MKKIGYEKVIQLENKKYWRWLKCGLPTPTQYLHDRVTPATLSPKPLAYDKPIDPSEIPRISTCTNTIPDNTNVHTKDDKYPWLDPDDK